MGPIAAKASKAKVRIRRAGCKIEIIEDNIRERMVISLPAIAGIVFIHCE